MDLGIGCKIKHCVHKFLTRCLGPYQGLTVEPQTILDVSGAVPEAAVDALMKACRSNSFAEVQQAITNSIADGFPVCIAAIRHHVCVGLVWVVQHFDDNIMFLGLRLRLCLLPMMCTSRHNCVAVGFGKSLHMLHVYIRNLLL